MFLKGKSAHSDLQDVLVEAAAPLGDAGRFSKNARELRRDNEDCVTGSKKVARNSLMLDRLDPMDGYVWKA